MTATPALDAARHDLENRFYMACLNLTGRRCLVVGAGPVALEKIEGLLVSGAAVTVVAPEAIDEVRNLAADEQIAWVKRGYEPADLDDVFLVIAATSDTRLNTQVHAHAEERSKLVNVADVPHLCNFILPAVVRDGPVAIAISTAGASPALAQRMKREASEVFHRAYADLAEILRGLRPWAQATLPTYRDRKEFFDAIVNGTPDPITELRERRRDELVERIDQLRTEHGAGGHGR